MCLSILGPDLSRGGLKLDFLRSDGFGHRLREFGVQYAEALSGLPFCFQRLELNAVGLSRAAIRSSGVTMSIDCKHIATLACDSFALSASA